MNIVTSFKSLVWVLGSLALILSARGGEIGTDASRLLAQAGLTAPGSRTAQFRIERGALSPQARLRKLSFHLKGITPIEEEYGALKEAIKNENTETFFSRKAQEYLASPQHIGK